MGSFRIAWGLAFVAPVQVVRRRFAAALGKYYFNFSGIVAQERKLYTLSIYLQYFCNPLPPLPVRHHIQAMRSGCVPLVLVFVRLVWCRLPPFADAVLMS